MAGARLALDKHPEELAAGVLAVVRDGALQTRGMGTAMTKDGDQPVTDIVERLRAGFFCREEAADEIERLRAPVCVEHQASADSESAMQRLLAAAGWDAGSIRHKQLEDALDVAGLRITDEPQTAQQLEIDSLKGAMRVLEEGYDRIKAERDAALAQPQTPSDSAALDTRNQTECLLNMAMDHIAWTLEQPTDPRAWRHLLSYCPLEILEAACLRKSQRMNDDGSGEVQWGSEEQS